MWSLSPTKPFAARSKKPPQASPEEAVGDPAHQERRFRVEDGGGFGSLRRALRSQKADDLLRRAAIPDALRCEGSPADETRPTRARRLRIPTRRQRLRAHDFRTARRLSRGRDNR